MKTGRPEYKGMVSLSHDKNSMFPKNNLFLVIIFILIITLNVFYVSAITGSLGNARMILRANEGDTIEKYILVKNVNEEEIKIGLRASGDLAEYIKLKETEFNLAPGEDKKAYFTIKVPSNGTTESRIEVTFAKADGTGNGVGLTSTVIVIAEENPGSNLNLLSNLDAKTTLIIIALVLILLILILIIYSKRKKSDRNKFKKSDETK
ncbi:MAG: hypothetical protein PHF67_04745 [Candidatus Nanoarchaeia archaeon]|nr:hypothetical protein [Candidatus Nanoarchaeia archaeon]